MQHYLYSSSTQTVLSPAVMLCTNMIVVAVLHLSYTAPSNCFLSKTKYTSEDNETFYQIRSALHIKISNKTPSKNVEAKQKQPGTFSKESTYDGAFQKRETHAQADESRSAHHHMHNRLLYLTRKRKI